jgi:thioredoxin reductase (NADPH)
MNTDIRELIIIGGGPAGYTAALYAARADLEPLVIEGFNWGGQLMITSDVENYPGFVDGIMGPDLMAGFRGQAERFGAEFLTDDVTRVDLTEQPLRVWVGDEEFRAKAVIVATGASARQLGLPSEQAMQGRGVTYCAVCDGAFYRDKNVIVVGGGDSAMEEAVFLTKFARKVSVVHRRSDFRASAIMLDRAREMENIELVTPYVVQRFEPGENGALGHAILEHTEDGSTKDIPITGAFVAIGHQPNSHLVDGQVETDDEGYVLVDGRSTRTKLPGVFAAGDLTDRVYRQAVTAAGTGCMAALDAEAYLRDTPIDPEAHWEPDPKKVEAAGEAVAEAAARSS